MVIQWQTGAAQVAGPTPDRDFVVSVVETPPADGGTTSTLVTNDVTWDTQIMAASDNNFKIETPGATFESETPAVASVDAQRNLKEKRMWWSLYRLLEPIIAVVFLVLFLPVLIYWLAEDFIRKHFTPTTTPGATDGDRS